MSFYEYSPLVGRVQGLWGKANVVSMLSSLVLGVGLVMSIFMKMGGVALALAWASLAVLGFALAVEIAAMYLVGVVSDDLSVIRKFRSDALDMFKWSALVFVCGAISLTLETFVR